MNKNLTMTTADTDSYWAKKKAKFALQGPHEQTDDDDDVHG